MKLRTVILIATIKCCIVINSCGSVETEYNFIVNHSDNKIEEKLLEYLIANKIPYKKNENGIVYVRKQDSEVVTKVLRDIQSDYSKKTYFVDFEFLKEARIYIKKLAQKEIPYEMSEGCCPRYYRVKSPPEYYEKARLVMEKHIQSMIKGGTHHNGKESILNY
ncbi:MAG: hypothetical protein MI892_08975 [Desulfobacterales bacterium]|nr:hypothetical protein [Desulfobacterales bacterium]